MINYNNKNFQKTLKNCRKYKFNYLILELYQLKVY